MPRRNSFSFKSVLLTFLLIFSLFWKLCDSQVDGEEEANEPPDGHGGDNGPFFALRSCHQLLHGDSGEFFSPDYLCSNPPLWCNWTIQVDPGKRIHLHLEDLTPDYTCHLKQDQIHVDEPAGQFVGHKVLQKCWQEAKYTSSSNTVYVVLLIGGWPNPPYRGFYGCYQVFGPPMLYNPQEGSTERHRKTDPSLGLFSLNEFSPSLNSEQMESDVSPHPSAADSVLVSYDQPSPTKAELPWEPEEDTDTELDKVHHLVPTVPASTLGTSRSGRGAPQTPSDSSDSAVHPASPQKQQDDQDHKPEAISHTPTAVRRKLEETPTRPEEPEEEPVGLENRTEVSETSDRPPSPSEGPEPEEAEQTRPQPNMMEPLSDHRGSPHVRNHSESPHLPGDHLFEVAVEVNFSPDVDESWDDVARSLLLSVKASVSQQLEVLHTPQSITSKRIKRLTVGVLYILWLHIGQGPGGPQIHRAVHAALQGLIATDIGGNARKAVIASVSTADVNECGTQLVLCDANADCVNRFGSYSCRCRPGFQDKSRLGSGGSVCVDVKAAAPSS
uniref:uncharacterized protein zgc:66455 isoform X2 n=1 Tax=Scatophagus argus TaxID=75038 RepID=UPI001ED7E0B1|nr:uncharacterized protein zgc:66455 isoform X2 [Scatophagus argus]